MKRYNPPQIANYVLLLLFLIIIVRVSVSEGACVKCHDMPEHYVNNGSSCTDCHSGIGNTTRQEIAHYRIIRGIYSYYSLGNNKHTQEGARIIERFSCRRCHVINNDGSNLASNLDMSVKRLISEEIADAIKMPNLQMPDFRLPQSGIDCLVNALLQYSRINPASNMVEIVQLGENKEAELFQVKCGGCHIMLSRNGTLGKRQLAPFLSGINKKYYPKVDNRAWSRVMLSDWLDNPRKIKPFAVMPVIKLNVEEKETLLDLIWGK